MTKLFRLRASVLLLASFLLLDSLRSCALQHSDASFWYHRYIGRLKHAVFYTSAKGKKMLFVATEQNVLASLNIKNGEIGGNTLQAWNITNGDLAWNTLLLPLGSPTTLDVTPIEIHHLQAKMIIIYGGLQLYSVSSADGQVLWSTNAGNASENGKFSLRRVITGEDKNSLYGVGFEGNSGFCVWKIYLFTGRLAMKEAATIKASICTDELVVTKNHVIGLDCDGKTIFTGHIGPVNSFSIHRTPIQNIVPDAFGKARLLKSTLQEIFVLRLIDQIVFMKIGRTGYDLKVIEIFQRPAVISNSLELIGNITSTMVAQHVGTVEDCKVALRLLTIEGERYEAFSHILDLDCDRGFVQQVHMSCYVRQDKSYGFRAVLVMEDYSLVYVQNAKTFWTREDGLAAISAIVAEELPTRKVVMKRANGPQTNWFKGYKDVLLAALKWKGGQEFSLERDKRERSKLVRDEHGLRKLLIVLTKGGKLFAIHTGTGDIVWSLLVPSFRKSFKRNNLVVLKILPWRHSINTTQTQNPVVLVVGNFGSKADASGILAWVDTYTGTELQSVHLHHAIEGILPLARNDFQTENLYLLIDVQKNIHIFPTTPETLGKLAGKDSRIIFPVVNVDKSIVVGYCFNLSAQMQADTEIPSSLVIASNEGWKIDFSQMSERLVAISQPDKVASTKGSVAAGSDLCGVLSNTPILLATTFRPISEIAEGEFFEETGLAFLFMDTMTGEILHKVTHSKARGPIYIVKDRNWFACYFFDSHVSNYKYAVLEILERGCEEDKDTNALNQPQRGSTILRSENVLHFPVLKTLGMMKGSTDSARQLLFGTHDGQIMSSGINEARSTSREGAILNWMTSLYSPSSQLNFTRSGPVAGLREIVSVPTMSGSLLFAYGIDILFAHMGLQRYAASSSYEYFFYVGIVTIGAMSVVVLISHVLPRHKRCKQESQQEK